MEPAKLPPPVLRALLSLGSVAYQDRYIANPTGDERIEPDNLLNEVFAIEHWVARGPASSPVKSVIYSFLASAHEHMDGIDPEQNILQDPAWTAIRNAAGTSLQHLGHAARLARMESGDFNSAMSL